VEQKFRNYAAAVLPQSGIEEVIHVIGRLEDFDSSRKLMALLRAGPRSRAMAAAVFG
jgi:hypothetical protein